MAGGGISAWALVDKQSRQAEMARGQSPTNSEGERLVANLRRGNEAAGFFSPKRRPRAVAGALIVGSGAPSRTSPGSMRDNRSVPCFTYWGERSNPRKRRFSFLAT